MKAVFRFARIAVCSLTVLFSALTVFSCSSSLGYSVVLWHDSEHALVDGQIVQVFIRSNISHVYVISLPDTSEKVEVPLWLLSEPQSKKKAQQLATRYSDYEHTYARVKLDGLPIRSEAVNTAKQVYRLREKEIIRVLYKGHGQAVTNGKGNLEGDWLRVMTEGGTTGWCFSYNLELFTQETATSALAAGDTLAVAETAGAQDETDTLLEAVKARHWYPEQFQTLIDVKRIDLAQMDPNYGFVIDEKKSTIALTLAGTQLSWSYTDIKKLQNREYLFEGTPVKMTVRRSDFIILEYKDSDRKLREENLVLLSENLSELLKTEANRRQKELEQLRLYGPTFESEHYGKLTFAENNTFKWTDFDLLVPAIIEKSAGGKGTLSIEQFISDALKVSYDGVLTFRFDGMESPVRFLYKIADGGLRLEDATHAQISNNVVMSRSTSQTTIFFTKR